MAWNRGGRALERLGGPRRLWAPAALLAIVTLAAVVRVVDIVANPPGFFADEASAGYNAYLIWTTGRDEARELLPFMFRAFGEYKLPVYIYSQVPLMAILGLSELAVRLTSAVYGILTIVSVYLLATALFKRQAIGVAAAFFLAVMPWHIHYSRTGFGEMVTFPFFLTLGTYLFILGTRRDSFLGPAALVLGLTLYTYRAAWVVLPPLLVLLLVLYWRELLPRWRYAWPSAVSMMIIALPLAVHLLTVDGDRSSQAWIFELDLGFWGTIERFADHYRSYFTKSFLFDEGDAGLVTRHYLPGYGHLFYIQLPLLIAGLGGLLWKPTREKLIVLALLALFPIAGAVSNESPISTRAILGTVVFAIISGYGLVLLWDLVRGLRVQFAPAVAGGLVAVVLAITLVNFGSYLEHYHGDYPSLSADFWGWQYGPAQVLKRFDEAEDDYDQLILDQSFNAPYIFYRFYLNDCDKCTLGHATRYREGTRQLFALRPENLNTAYQYETIDIVPYPDGSPAFLLVEIVGLREAAVAR